MRLFQMLMMAIVLCAATLPCVGRAAPGHSADAAQAAWGSALAAPVAIQNSIQVAPDPVDMLIDPATRHVFVTADTGDVVSVLDAHSGRLLAETKVGYEPTLMALDSRTEHLVVLNSNADIHPRGKTKYGSISIIDVRRNRVIRTVPLRWNPYAVVVDSGAGRAFVVGNTRAMLVLDTATGATVRTVQLPAGLELDAMAGTMRFDPLTHHVFIQGSTVTLDRLIGGMVVTVDSLSGTVLRAQTLATNPIDTALNGAGGRLYVSGTDTPSGTLPGPHAVTGTVSILDTATGRLLRTERHVYRAADIFLQSADTIMYDGVTGHLFVEDHRAGAITMLGSDGTPLRTISSLAGASALAVYGARHHLFVTIERTETAGIAQIDVLDTRTGALVQTLPLDPSTFVFPQVTAVNGATGHVFIAYRSDAVLTLADGVAPQPLPTQPPANAADAVNLRLADLPAGTTVLGRQTGTGAHVAAVLSSPGQTGTLIPSSGATAASMAGFAVTHDLTATSILSLVVSFRTAAQAHAAFIMSRNAITSGAATPGTDRWSIGILGQERLALIATVRDAHGRPLTDSLVLFRQGIYVAIDGVFNGTAAYPATQAARLAAIVDARIRSTRPS